MSNLMESALEEAEYGNPIYAEDFSEEEIRKCESLGWIDVEGNEIYLTSTGYNEYEGN